MNIVLYEPEMPANTGNIGRTCVATNTKLHLIEPLGFKLSEKHLVRAGLDYWDKLDITYYDSLQDFFEKTAKDNPKYYYFTTKGKNVYSDVKYEDNCYILFGREDKGLPEELLHDNKDSCVRFPMRPELRSLNLSNSVAIAVYEILRQWDFPDLSREGRLTRFTWED